MKTVTGRIISAKPISLSKAATLLSVFASSDNGASQDVSAYLQRASAAFTELKSIHREIESSSLEETKPRSDVRRDRNPTGEFDELGRANKGIDDLVEKGGKIRDRKSETVSDDESIYGREQDEIKEDTKKKKKSKKKKEEGVVDEKGKKKLEDEQRNEERKEKKKKKSKKKKEEDVVDEKVKEKLEEEQRNEERKEEKKKRKSDVVIGFEEKKSKKRRKSKEIDG